MAKDNIRAGGFCGVNRGSLENCYSLVRIRASKKKFGGFVGENSGVIRKSFSFTSLRGLRGGFTGTVPEYNKNTEESPLEISDCYFFHNEKRGGKKIKKLIDHDFEQRLSEVESADDIGTLGFDTDNIWQYTTDEDKRAKKHKSPLIFIPEKWMFDIRSSRKLPEYVKLPLYVSGGEEHEKTPQEQLLETPLEEVRRFAYEISNADQLFEFAENINKGDNDTLNAYVRLTEDIDLGGKEWTPIGKERLKAFNGIFDGEGHTVSNFVVKDKKVDYKGFFGFNKGEIYNLTVDCYIKSGISSGAICAVNDDGIIGCCGAVTKISGKSGHYGGLCGRNNENGFIFQSYTAGKMLFAIIPLWFGAPLLPIATLIIATQINNALPATTPKQPIYPPPPYDEDQVKTDDGLTPNAEGNFVSFQFEQAVDVNLITRLCKFNFKNPGNSNHDIIVQLQFTDAQAKRVMGGTGRSAEEQAEIESAANYDPETYRCVIAESKAIRPGYQLDELRLLDFENGAALPPGDYNAVVYLVFYDIETHDRAMLESQLPVIISVHN